MKKLIFVLALLAAVKTQAQQKYQVYNLSVVNPKQWLIPKNDTLDYELGAFDGQKALSVKFSIINRPA
jgi:hypothetical protein